MLTEYFPFSAPLFFKPGKFKDVISDHGQRFWKWSNEPLSTRTYEGNYSYLGLRRIMMI